MSKLSYLSLLLHLLLKFFFPLFTRFLLLSFHSYHTNILSFLYFVWSYHKTKILLLNYCKPLRTTVDMTVIDDYFSCSFLDDKRNTIFSLTSTPKTMSRNYFPSTRSLVYLRLLEVFITMRDENGDG